VIRLNVLLRQATDAALLVIGSAGHVGFLGAMAGSTSRHCARAARCPVTILGPKASTAGVTGYLTSATLDAGGGVTRWLAAECARRPLPVNVVDSWNIDAVMPGPMYGPIPFPAGDAARTEHDRAVERMRSEQGAGVSLAASFRRGVPADGFRFAARPGYAVVVPRSALQDVSFTHETCPVIVVPNAYPEEQRSATP
jgi:hypothetical protein